MLPASLRLPGGPPDRGAPPVPPPAGPAPAPAGGGRAGLAVAPGSDLRRVADNWLENPVDLVVVVGGEAKSLAGELSVLRGVTETPVIVLAAHPGDGGTAALPAAGAGLVLRPPARLRRSGGLPPFALPVLDLGEVMLNPSDRTVRVAQREAQRLTQLEFRLLYILMTNRDQVIPAEVILERVWGYTGTGSRELLRNLASRLRSKVEPAPGNPRFIP